MRSRALRRKLREGRSTFGSWISSYDVAVAETMVEAGFDWLLIDLWARLRGERHVGAVGVPALVAAQDLHGRVVVFEQRAVGAAKVGELIATHIIARPHVNVDLVLPLGRKTDVEKEIASRGGR